MRKYVKQHSLNHLIKNAHTLDTRANHCFEDATHTMGFFFCLFSERVYESSGGQYRACTGPMLAASNQYLPCTGN